MLPAGEWWVCAFAFGTVIGSFLNVCIWRLPRGESLIYPGSHCPYCDHQLGPADLVPLLSFLIRRGRCRYCGRPISWRYFGVELLTGLIFALLAYRFQFGLDFVAYSLFTAALIVAFFIDAESFFIPDEVNHFALLMGVGRDIYGIAQNETSHSLIDGWLPHSILTAVICAAIFVGIRILGTALFRKEAMGLGDVKLARAIGAMLPIGAALTSFFMAVIMGAVLGPVILLVKQRRSPPSNEDAIQEKAVEEDIKIPFLRDSLESLQYLLFLDIPITIWMRFKRRPESEPLVEDEDWQPGATHIPFGPFMAVGAVAAIFIGNQLTDWYLRWSHLGMLFGGKS